MLDTGIQGWREKGVDAFSAAISFTIGELRCHDDDDDLDNCVMFSK